MNNTDCTQNLCLANSDGATSSKISCKIAGTDDILESINDDTKAALSAKFAAYNPPVTNADYSDPVQVGTTVVINIQVSYDAALPDPQQRALETQMANDIADEIGTPRGQVVVSVTFAGSQPSPAKRSVDDTFVYDAVAQISGAVELVASAFMSLVFLALFI